MPIETSLADNYKARPVPGFGSIDVSFFADRGDGQFAPCVNAAHSVGMITNQFDGEYRVVYAMLRPNEDVGTYTSYTSKLARELAQALIEMADYVDKENAKPRKEDEEDSLVETIRKSGGTFINLNDYMEPDPNAQNQVVWTLSGWAHNHGVTYDALGHIPSFLHYDDPRPAKEQIDANYQHGGGWHEANEDGHWKIIDGKLQGHRDDAAYNLVASCQVGPDEVLLFDSAWCAIIHVPDSAMSVARLD